jgi:GDP-L-fucose synthase
LRIGDALSDFWSGKRVMVTGGRGFLGRRVVAAIEPLQPAALVTFSSSDYDLTRQLEVERLFKEHRSDLVIHLAARVGGIGANREYPGRFLYENAIMGLEVIEQAHLNNVAKTVVVGTVCAYPKNTPVPFTEEELWNGYPEETNAPYGLAKKLLLVQAQAYRHQYGLNAVYLLPANLYGPGDNFDPASSHVIPAMIRRCLEARDADAAKVTMWGTGHATREFLYVDDAARAIVLAAEHYNGSEPVNIGSSEEISIRDLAETVREATGFSGRIEWDRTKPDGQPRRKLNIDRAEREFGFRSTTNFRDGLRQTVRWYLEHAPLARHGRSAALP